MDRPIRRPRRRLLELALLSLIAVAIVLVSTLRLPIADVKAERYDNSQLKLTHAGGSLLLPGDARLVVTPARGAPIVVRADTVIDGIAARGSRIENNDWWAKREAVSEALGVGPIAIRLPDGSTFQAQTSTRRLRDLTGGFWAALATGFAGLLCGMWTLVIRPRSNSARTFAVMSLGLFGVGCTLAAGHDPLMLGEGYRVLMLANHASVQLFAGAILMLFCRFPVPLLGRRWAWAIGVAAAALVAVDVADLTGDTVFLLFASIVVEFLLFVMLLVGQAWAARSDPVGSAAMRLIGLSAVLSSAFFIAMVILPMLVAGAPLVSEAIALPLLLVIYAGLGAAIARHRLFTVDGWAPALLLSVCAAVAVTGIDLAILSMVAETRGIALPVAVVIVGIFYIPLRETITRRTNRRRDAATRRSLRLASELAFVLTADERAARWRKAIGAMFAPLEMASDAQPVDSPCLAESGLAMRLPRIGDVPGLILRYAQRGARDFDAADVAQATEVIEVVEALTGARDAYVSGMAKERARIARDLHDDVSARLLTSLHREDQNTMRKDVREAMADIRAIISGTTGSRRPIADVLADIRFETANRLDAHGIALSWPIAAAGTDHETIDDGSARHLASIVRELVSNVARHADARSVAVEIAIAGRRLALSIIDDGKGFEPSTSPGNGLGNIAHRAEALGGSFQIRGSDKGTVAAIEIALEAAVSA